jgi:hypothetical protein
MNEGLDKYSCLRRAKDLIGRGDLVSLRYAALELRYCMEAITYDKLSAYSSRLPPELLATWQPPQAMRALVEIEEHAEEDYKVFVGTGREGAQGGPLSFIGEHRSLKAGWLNREYNRLGSVLHVPNRNDRAKPGKYETPSKLRERLASLVDDLQPVVESSATAVIAKCIEFECTLCQRCLVVTEKAARTRRRVKCLHPDCQVNYAVEIDEDGELRFGLSDTTFTCRSCGATTVFPEARIKVGVRFDCVNCGGHHVVVEHAWRYAQVSG